MERIKFESLNSYQIAGMTVAASTLAAVSVLFVLRRSGIVGRKPAGSPSSVSPQPAVSTVSSVRMPDHFSEDLLVPGLTHTGPEILQHDDENGRSPEGV